MAGTEGYNGWTNRETWCLNLHIDSDQGLHDYWMEKAEELLSEYIKENTESDARVLSAKDLADEMKDWMDELIEDKINDDLLSDLFPDTMNYYEIATNMVEGLDVLCAKGVIA